MYAFQKYRTQIWAGSPENSRSRSFLNVIQNTLYAFSIIFHSEQLCFEVTIHFSYDHRTKPLSRNTDVVAGD